MLSEEQKKVMWNRVNDIIDNELSNKEGMILAGSYLDWIEFRSQIVLDLEDIIKEIKATKEHQVI